MVNIINMVHSAHKARQIFIGWIDQYFDKTLNTTFASYYNNGADTIKTFTLRLYKLTETTPAQQVKLTAFPPSRKIEALFLPPAEPPLRKKQRKHIYTLGLVPERNKNADILAMMKYCKISKYKQQKLFLSLLNSVSESPQKLLLCIIILLLDLLKNCYPHFRKDGGRRKIFC